MSFHEEIRQFVDSSVSGKEQNISSEKNRNSGKAKKIFKCNQTCVHEGDRICYNEIADKEILEQLSPSDISQSASSGSLELDSLHSGESLFKTFTFETDESDPDIAKCMSFWQSILEKNIKPTKCTIITQDRPTEQRKKQSGKPVKPNKPIDESKTIQEKTWLDIYKKLQQQKLDKLKLVKKQQCQNPCDEYIDETEKSQEAEIKKLNNWIPNQQSIPHPRQNSQVKQPLKAAKKPSTSSNVNKSKKTSAAVMADIAHNTSMPTRVITEDSAPTSVTKSMDKLSEDLQHIQEEDTAATAKTTESVPKMVEETEQYCCSCGCKSSDCVCHELYDVLSWENDCPCNSECSCFDSTQNVGRPPDCGVHEGAGENLFLDRCSCENIDCSCDIVDVVSTYVESLETLVNVTRETQTGEIVAEAPESPIYCVICGHFDCFCKNK